MTSNEKDLKLFSVFAGIFVATLLISNVTATKIAAFGPLTLPGSVILFPISYIFGDILTEVYGYNRSRKIIWTGLACVVLAALAYRLVGLLPAAPFWPNQTAYDTIFGVSLRVALASIVAYWCGEFSNSVVLSKMKYWEKGKRGFSQAYRFIMSTVVGEGVDSIVFMTIAFAGVFETRDLIKTIIGLYIFKVVYEVIATPFSTRFANWVKKVEGIDQIDYPEKTNYNPFKVIKSL